MATVIFQGQQGVILQQAQFDTIAQIRLDSGRVVWTDLSLVKYKDK